MAEQVEMKIKPKLSPRELASKYTNYLTFVVLFVVFIHDGTMCVPYNIYNKNRKNLTILSICGKSHPNFLLDFFKPFKKLSKVFIVKRLRY